jgi:hypothetical protein
MKKKRREESKHRVRDSDHDTRFETCHRRRVRLLSGVNVSSSSLELSRSLRF